MKTGFFEGWNPDVNPLTGIYALSRPFEDAGLLIFKDALFPNRPYFEFGRARILDEVMTMGYPPIPGFRDVLISETAKIAGSLKATTGELVAYETATLDRNEYFLISARVKGGNSGGPVITATVKWSESSRSRPNRRGDLLGAAASVIAV